MQSTVSLRDRPQTATTTTTTTTTITTTTTTTTKEIFSVKNIYKVGK